MRRMLRPYLISMKLTPTFFQLLLLTCSLLGWVKLQVNVWIWGKKIGSHEVRNASINTELEGTLKAKMLFFQSALRFAAIRRSEEEEIEFASTNALMSKRGYFSYSYIVQWIQRPPENLPFLLLTVNSQYFFFRSSSRWRRFWRLLLKASYYSCQCRLFLELPIVSAKQN